MYYINSATLIFSIISLSEARRIEIDGVFENVEVHFWKRFNSNEIREEKIVVDFDDTLSGYIPRKETVLAILIENQYISKLAFNSIANLPQVRNVSLPLNKIRIIQSGAFHQLPQLEMLNLSYNAIDEIKDGVFTKELSNLKCLHLDHNKITRIGHRAFNNLKLETIFLNENLISRWGREWFSGTSLKFLNVAKNRIDELPSNAFYSMNGNNASLSIIFDENQLRKIGNNVFNGISNLVIISLESNHIDRIELEAFNSVKTIKVLNLNNNSISDLSAKLFESTRIEVLRLEENKVRCLSTDLFQMEELDIDGNPITCSCVKGWLEWRGIYSNPSIYHLTNLEQECI